MRMYRILSVALIVASLWGEAALAGRGQKTVLVIPSRHRLVQFAMDIARLRPTYIVAYGPRNSPSDTAFYLWNAQTEEWKDISMEEYEKGSVFDASAQILALVGTDKDLPAGLPSQPNWATKTERIGSLNPAEMANALNGIMKFTPVEWRWLARRYGLTITDVNAERRRYGKYGPPGTQRGPKMPEASVEPPPAPMPPAAGEEQKIAPASPSPEPAEPKFDVAVPPAPAPAEAATPPAQAPAPVVPPKRPEDK